MKTFIRWLPVAAWCGFIFILSSIPNLDSGLAYDYPLRKLAHMIEYGILYFLLQRARVARMGSVLFCIFYAMSDEYHQTWVVGRDGCLKDVLVDTAGIFIAWGSFFRGRAFLKC